MSGWMQKLDSSYKYNSVWSEKEQEHKPRGASGFRSYIPPNRGSKEKGGGGGLLESVIDYRL